MVVDVELLSPHGIVLLRLAQDPRSRAQDIADRLSVTERAAQRLIGDLIEAGLVVQVGDGPTSGFEVPEAVRQVVLPIDGVGRSGSAANGGGSKRHEIRTRLLAAVDRIVESGETYAETNVERLVSEAGISRSTFYAHFQDKADLLQALAAQVLDEMWAAANSWISLPPSAGRTEVRSAMHGVVMAYWNHRVVMVAAADSLSSSRSNRAKYEDLMRRTVARIAAHIVDGQREGYVRPDLDPGDAATLLTWGTERGLYKLVGQATTDDAVEQAGLALADLVWNLLYAGYR